MTERKDLCDNCGGLFVARRRSHRFCSPRCAQQFRERENWARKQGNRLPLPVAGEYWRMTGSLPIWLRHVDVEPLRCEVCGRSPGPGEGLDKWRVHVIWAGTRAGPRFLVTCPAHF